MAHVERHRPCVRPLSIPGPLVRLYCEHRHQPDYTFRLVKHDGTGAYFSGHLPAINPDLMEGYLALRNRADGTVREEKFVYRREK